MASVLIVVGILVAVVCVISTIALGTLFSSFWSAILILTLTAALVAILFALAKILENQEVIRFELQKTKQDIVNPVSPVTCTKCGKEFGSDYSSCPFCGTKK